MEGRREEEEGVDYTQAGGLTHPFFVVSATRASIDLVSARQSVPASCR